MLGSELHQVALDWAARGIPVFPCGPFGRRTPEDKDASKHPACKGGYLAATTDVGQIDAWWEQADYNVGVSPGTAGWTVLDVDPKNGGDVTLAGLEIAHGPLETYAVSTPSGGFHFYFKGATKKNSAGRLGKGLDTRSERGYVLVPPSQTENGYYEDAGFAASDEIADLPDWVLAGLDTTDRSREASDVELDLPINVSGFREWLSRQPGATAGERNETASTIIGYACDYGVSKATALPLIYEWGRRCDPPIPEPDDKIENHGVWLSRQNSGAPLALEGPTSSLFKLPDDIAQSTEKERFYPYFVSDLLARPPPEWLIRDVIAERSIGHFYGETESFKSYVTAALAFDMGGSVIYGVGEGEDTFAYRVKALETLRQREHGIRIVASLPLIGEPGDVVEFIAAMKRHKVNPRLVVLDTLTVAMESLDESTARDMGRFVAAMKLIRSELNTAVLAIHHKSDKVGATKERGSSVLKAGVDFAAEIERWQDTRYVKMTMRKQRAAEKRKLPFAFQGLPVPVGRENPDLAFSEIEIEEWNLVTGARKPSGDIAKRMAAKGLWGAEKGVTTDVLAAMIREPVEGESGADVDRDIKALAKDLNFRAKRDLGVLGSGEGKDRRWWLEPMPDE